MGESAAVLDFWTQLNNFFSTAFAICRCSSMAVGPKWVVPAPLACSQGRKEKAERVKRAGLICIGETSASGRPLRIAVSRTCKTKVSEG